MSNAHLIAAYVTPLLDIFERTCALMALSYENNRFPSIAREKREICWGECYPHISGILLESFTNAARKACLVSSIKL